MGTDVTDQGDPFLVHRDLLFSIAYNLLGSVADTEDVLQETWLSWSGRTSRPGDEIRNPRAYLVRIAVNHALARHTTIKRRRETYIGPWLPEPLVTEGGEEQVLRPVNGTPAIVSSTATAPTSSSRSIWTVTGCVGCTR